VHSLAKTVNKLLDPEIKFWIKNNIRFDAKPDGQGLYLRFRNNDKYPVFFFRFKLAGVENKILLGKSLVSHWQPLGQKETSTVID
jgi:hypothetical protein